ncbi:MAG: alpha/beta hydrolase [Halorientalis sp.]
MDEVRIAGDRDVRVTVDTPDAGAAVVACPPHPQLGGRRTDPRLRAVGRALGERGVACLRFDYGPWDGGEGERRDARTVLARARREHDPVGLFGYSFGAGVALLTAAGDPPAALSVLAPPATLAGEDTTDAVATVNCPLQVLHGERDGTVDWRAVLDRAPAGAVVESFPTGHGFGGHHDDVGASVGAFFAEALE